MHNLHGSTHAIKPRHVHGDRQAAGSCRANVSRASVLRASRATFAPRPDSAIAVARPIPDEAPMTMKTRSSICIVRSSLIQLPQWIAHAVSFVVRALVD